MIITLLIVGMILGAGGMALLVNGHVQRTKELRDELSHSYATIQALRSIIDTQKSQIETLSRTIP